MGGIFSLSMMTLVGWPTISNARTSSVKNGNIESGTSTDVCRGHHKSGALGQKLCHFKTHRNILNGLLKKDPVWRLESK